MVSAKARAFSPNNQHIEMIRPVLLHPHSSAHIALKLLSHATCRSTRRMSLPMRGVVVVVEMNVFNHKEWIPIILPEKKDIIISKHQTRVALTMVNWMYARDKWYTACVCFMC